jgi:predicted dehydrogenase
MTIKAAVVGAGQHGRRVLQALGDEGVEVVAVVDSRQEALDLATTSSACRKLQDATLLWTEAQLDLVCIATNGPSHAPLALAAIAAGVPRVMIEKPMACSVSDCDRLLEAAARVGTRLAVNQSRRHDPFYRWVREQVRSGRWGAPLSLWIQRPGIGLGCLGTHSFDLAAFLFDTAPRKVSGWIDTPHGRNPRGEQFKDPGGLVVMDFGEERRAVVAQLEAGAGPMSVELDLSGARIRIDEKLNRIEILTRAPHAGGGAVGSGYLEEIVPQGLSAKTDMNQMLRGLIREVTGEGQMTCDGTHGRLAVEVLAAAHLSAERGGIPMSIPLTDPKDRDLWLPVT